MVMWIDDDELRELFKTSSEERLQNIDAGLLHLEKHPDDAKVIDAIMRDAHSLKGDSNMLGLKDIGTISHEVEHIFKAVQQGDQVVTPELCDRLATTLTAVAQMVQEAVTGEACGVNPFYVLAQLMGGSGPPDPEASPSSSAHSTPTSEESDLETHAEPVTPPHATATTDSTIGADARADADTTSAEGSSNQAAPDRQLVSATVATTGSGNPHHNGHGTANATHANHPSGNPNSPPPPDSSLSDSSSGSDSLTTSSIGSQDYRIETIRVPTHNLDTLMTHAGELTVTKIRVAHRLAEIESITRLWEEWNRDFFVNRFLFDEGKNSSTQAQPLQAFYNRGEGYLQKLGSLSEHLRSALYEDITRLEMIGDELEEGIRTLRLLPLSTLFNLFPRMVRDLARQQKKQVDLVIEGGETKADKRIVEEMRDPLMHMTGMPSIMAWNSPLAVANWVNPKPPPLPCAATKPPVVSSLRSRTTAKDSISMPSKKHPCDAV